MCAAVVEGADRDLPAGAVLDLTDRGTKIRVATGGLDPMIDTDWPRSAEVRI